MKLKRGFLVVLFCCLLIMASWGTGGLVYGAKKQVTVWFWSAHTTQMWKDWFSYLKKTFEAKHPDVELKIDLVPWGADKITVAVIGGAVPDVSIASAAYARDLFESGALMPLNKYVDKTPELAPDKMIPATQIFNQMDGQIFGISNSLEANCIGYDADMFEATGLDSDPFAMATWSDFLSYATKLTKKGADGKISRFGYAQYVGRDGFTCFLYSNGGTFYDKSLMRANFNNSRGVEALSFMRDLVYTYNVSTWAGGEDALSKGTAAMGFMETAPVFLLEAAPELNLRVTSFPVGPSGQSRGTQAWSNMFVIPKGARNPDLGWEFIKHYMSLESQIQQFKILKFPFSPRKDFYTTDAWKSVATTKSAKWMMSVPQIFNVANIYAFRRSTQVDPKIAPIMADALFFKLSPQEALARMEQIINQELAKK